MSDIIKDLQYGELSAHGMFVSHPISEQDKERLIYHTNIALTELYTRFPLFTRELTLIQKEGKTVYLLDKVHAVTNKDDVNYDKYIIDSPEFPFNNDLIRILSVFNEEGDEIRINDSTADCVVTTPAPDMLEVPVPIDTNALFIIYQANHYKIATDTDELMLPTNFKPALLAYIAYRVYSGGTAQEHVNLANLMLQKYELFCTQQRDYGTDNSMEFERNTKPCLGGWV